MGSFAIDLVAMTFGMPRALFAVLALTVFDAGASGTGLLYASVSAGATVAALTTGWVEHARWLGRIVIGAVIVWGLAIAAAGFMPSLWPAAALLAVAGAADSISAVCRSIINQTVTPEHLRGRMSAIFMLVVTSGPRLGDLESGIAASLTTASVAVVSGGFACVVGVAVIVALFPALARYDGRQVAVVGRRALILRRAPALRRRLRGRLLRRRVLRGSGSAAAPSSLVGFAPAAPGGAVIVIVTSS